MPLTQRALPGGCTWPGTALCPPHNHLTWDGAPLGTPISHRGSINGSCGGPGLHGNLGCGLHLLFPLLWSFGGGTGSPHRAQGLHLPPVTVPSPAKFLLHDYTAAKCPRSLFPRAAPSCSCTAISCASTEGAEDTPPSAGPEQRLHIRSPGRSSELHCHFIGRSRKGCF